MENELISKDSIGTANKAMPGSKLRVFAAVLIVLAMVLSMSTASYAVTIKTVNVSMDGQTLKVALESEGVLFLPLRTVCEALGYTVGWSQADGSVTVKSADKTVLVEPKKDTVTDGRHSYFVGGQYPDFGYIGAGCISVSGRTYIDAAILASCFGVTEAYDQASNTYTLSRQPQANITAENVKTTFEDDKLQSTIQYPRITAADQAVSDQINAVILADVAAAQKEMQDNLKDMEGYQSPNRCETYFNYRIAYQQGDILSLALTDYQYYGGAHGSDKQITHTFDLKTGKEYTTLADLMKSGSGYVDYINGSIKNAIVERELADAQLTEFVSIPDHQSYYLTDRGLAVYFQQYEYFPYAAGIQEFVFPWAELEQYLKPEFQGN
jgi:inhibitor of cysteine peptidase